MPLDLQDPLPECQQLHGMMRQPIQATVVTRQGDTANKPDRECTTIDAANSSRRDAGLLQPCVRREGQDVPCVHVQLLARECNGLVASCLYIY